MKAIIFAGVVALALTSMAQETQAPAAAAPATKMTEAKSEMKKASKGKKAKKGKHKAQIAAPAPAVAVAAAPVVVAPAAATSVATEAAAPAPAKKWGTSVNLNPASDYTAAGQVGMLSTFGISYKVTDAWKASLKHTFESVAADSKRKLSAEQAAVITDSEDLKSRVSEANDRADLESNNFRSAYTDIGASTSLPAFFGSDAISLSLSTRIISRDAISTTRGVLSKINAHLDATAVMPFTLTPKWSAAVLGQYRHYDVKDDGQDRVILQPSGAYAFNDIVSVYQAAGVLYSTQKAQELRPRRTRILLETGVDIAPMKGLGINLNINQDKAVASTVDKVTPFNVYQPDPRGATSESLDAVAYEANVSYSF